MASNQQRETTDRPGDDARTIYAKSIVFYIEEMPPNSNADPDLVLHENLRDPKDTTPFVILEAARRSENLQPAPTVPTVPNQPIEAPTVPNQPIEVPPIEAHEVESQHALGVPLAQVQSESAIDLQTVPGTAEAQEVQSQHAIGVPLAQVQSESAIDSSDIEVIGSGQGSSKLSKHKQGGNGHGEDFIFDFSAETQFGDRFVSDSFKRQVEISDQSKVRTEYSANDPADIKSMSRGLRAIGCRAIENSWQLSIYDKKRDKHRSADATLETAFVFLQQTGVGRMDKVSIVSQANKAQSDFTQAGHFGEFINPIVVPNQETLSLKDAIGQGKVENYKGRYGRSYYPSLPDRYYKEVPGTYNAIPHLCNNLRTLQALYDQLDKALKDCNDSDTLDVGIDTENWPGKGKPVTVFQIAFGNVATAIDLSRFFEPEQRTLLAKFFHMLYFDKKVRFITHNEQLTGDVNGVLKTLETIGIRFTEQAKPRVYAMQRQFRATDFSKVPGTRPIVIHSQAISLSDMCEIALGKCLAKEETLGCWPLCLDREDGVIYAVLDAVVLLEIKKVIDRCALENQGGGATVPGAQAFDSNDYGYDDAYGSDY